MSFRALILTVCFGSAIFAVPAHGQVAAPVTEQGTAEDLQSALVAVYESNPRLLAERARLREIDETYVQARAQGRPTVGGTASISQSWVNFPNGAAVFTGGTETGDINISGRPNDIGVQIRVAALRRSKNKQNWVFWRRGKIYARRKMISFCPQPALMSMFGAILKPPVSAEITSAYCPAS